MIIKGYHLVSIPLQKSGAFSSFVYIKQHFSRGGDDLPQGRTMFIANIPVGKGIDMEAYLREAFGEYGEVENVKLNGKILETSGSASRSVIGFIVFRTTKGLKNAMSCTRLAKPIIDQNEAADFDVQRLLKRFKAEAPPVRALQAEVDAYMASFEEAEVEEERRRKETVNQPDADGFVTVTYGKKRRRTSGSDGKGGEGGGKAAKRGRGNKKKRGTYELQNFYAHQIREAKREQLARLREKFEEDKVRIEKMKAARKFKPFG